MQFSEKCSLCQCYFNEQQKNPFMLPCSHSICQTCLTNEFRRQSQNKCPICQKISKIHPSKLLKNDQIIQKLQQKEQKQKQISVTLESLKDQRSQLKQINQKIAQAQSSITYEVINLINKIYFPQQKQVSKEISSKIHEISHLIKVFEQYKEQLTFTQIDKLNEQQYSQLEENLKLLQLQGNQQIYNLEKQKKEIQQLLQQLFKSSTSYGTQQVQQAESQFAELLKNNEQ